MFRLRFAGCLALFVGIATFVISVMNEARPTTILYRSVISVSIFGLLGYLLAGLTGNWLAAKSSNLKSSAEPATHEQANGEPPGDPAFDPFTPDKFEHISSSKD